MPRRLPMLLVAVTLAVGAGVVDNLSVMVAKLPEPNNFQLLLTPDTTSSSCRPTRCLPTSPPAVHEAAASSTSS